MSSMKYIVTEHGDPFIFSELYSHREIAARLNRAVIGAGFCRLTFPRQEFVCFGNSISLGISSRGKEDSDAVNKAFRLVDRD